MLNQHPDIYIIPPIPIYEIIWPYLASYGDLEKPENWLLLRSECHELYEHNHYPLPYSLDFDEYLAATDNRRPSLASAVDAIIEHIARESGRSVVGLKFGAQERIAQHFISEMNFDSALLQVRDPRDVALSVFKAGVDTRTPHAFVRHWKSWHAMIVDTLEREEKPFVMHRYEELIADPIASLEPAWQFLGVAPCDRVLDFHEDPAQRLAAQTSYMWQNLDKPLMQQNKGKFYAEWGVITTKRMDWSIGAETLRAYGYKPARLSRFSPKDWFVQPERKTRTEQDSAFQQPQNAIASRIRVRYIDWKNSSRR